MVLIRKAVNSGAPEAYRRWAIWFQGAPIPVEGEPYFIYAEREHRRDGEIEVGKMDYPQCKDEACGQCDTCKGTGKPDAQADFATFAASFYEASDQDPILLLEGIEMRKGDFAGQTL